LGSGKPDLVVALAGRIRRFPRPWGGYPERRGYYSRLEYVARHAAEVWCPSTNSVNDVRNRFAVEAVPVPFCYDSDRFGPPALEPKIIPAVPTILSISRLVPHKNHAVLLRAAARLPIAVTIRIIGRGPEAHNLRRLAGELGVSLDLSDSWATDQEIVAAYRSASVVVSASRFEGFGLTPIEGLAMGLPVIASDIPPHREFLDGLVQFFPPDDAGALATAMEAVLKRSGPPAVHAPSSHPPASLTIEGCATRFLPGLERLLRGAR
jgi:glycosyltransferase involved in cell wall biosynthesis